MTPGRSTWPAGTEAPRYHVCFTEDGLVMDVFKIDQSLSANLGSAPPPEKLNAEVSFDAGSEFNLSFFDGTPGEDGFSDPGSVGSTSVSSPPPPQLVSTPSLLHQPSASNKPGTPRKLSRNAVALAVIISTLEFSTFSL